MHSLLAKPTACLPIFLLCRFFYFFFWRAPRAVNDASEQLQGVETFWREANSCSEWGDFDMKRTSVGSGDILTWSEQLQGVWTFWREANNCRESGHFNCPPGWIKYIVIDVKRTTAGSGGILTWTFYVRSECTNRCGNAHRTPEWGHLYSKEWGHAARRPSSQRCEWWVAVQRVEIAVACPCALFSRLTSFRRQVCQSVRWEDSGWISRYVNLSTRSKHSVS